MLSKNLFYYCEGREKEKLASLNNEGYIFCQFLKEAFLIQTGVFAGQYPDFFPLLMYIKKKLKGIFLERHLRLGDSHLINPREPSFSGDVQLFAQLGLNFLFI